MFLSLVVCSCSKEESENNGVKTKNNIIDYKKYANLKGEKCDDILKLYPSAKENTTEGGSKYLITNINLFNSPEHQYELWMSIQGDTVCESKLKGEYIDLKELDFLCNSIIKTKETFRKAKISYSDNGKHSTEKIDTNTELIEWIEEHSKTKRINELDSDWGCIQEKYRTASKINLYYNNKEYNNGRSRVTISFNN